MSEKPISRQALAMRELRRRGMCVSCWKPSDYKAHCKACAKKNRDRMRIHMRNKLGCKPYQEGKRGRKPIEQP